MKKKRNLDGYFFRVHRDDKYQTLCFSDLTREEAVKVLEKYNKFELTNLAVGLANRMYQIAEAYNITLWGDYNGVR